LALKDKVLKAFVAYLIGDKNAEEFPSKRELFLCAFYLSMAGVFVRFSPLVLSRG